MPTPIRASSSVLRKANETTSCALRAWIYALQDRTAGPEAKDGSVALLLERIHVLGPVTVACDRDKTFASVGPAQEACSEKLNSLPWHGKQGVSVKAIQTKKDTHWRKILADGNDAFVKQRTHSSKLCAHLLRCQGRPPGVQHRTGRSTRKWNRTYHSSA